MRILFLLISLLLLSGCSTRGHKVYNASKKAPILQPNKQDDTAKFNISQNNNYKSIILFSEYEKWKGTPYRLGGVSMNGVDCSSFIQQVYYDGFGLRIPRTTIKQLKVGYEIDKQDLRAGDMIFFKTGYNVRHVGIIIENGKFMHASTSKGVMISSINNPYWKDKYYKSIKVLP